MQGVASQATDSALERGNSGASSVLPLRSLSSASMTSGTIPAVRMPDKQAPKQGVRASSMVIHLSLACLSKHAVESCKLLDYGRASQLANASELSPHNAHVQERPKVKLEVALLLNVAVDGVHIKALHNDAAFLLELDAVRASIASENATKDVR